VSVGMVATICPLYVSECVETKQRGKFGTIFQISICAAILIAYLINFGFNQTNQEILPAKYFKIQLALTIIPSFALLVTTLFIQETPVYKK
jgi:Na+/melibiose symporter-like transporter